MNRLMRVFGITVAMLLVGAVMAIGTSEGTGFAGVVEVLATTEMAAQANGNGGGGGLTCGWCEEDPECFLGECWWEHSFPSGGDECGWANGNGAGGGGAECSRCGGDSDCHPTSDPGMCHLECGPGGGELFAAAVRDLEASIQRADVAGIARVVRTIRWMAFTPGERSIRVAAPCGEVGPPTVYTLPLAVADRFTSLLADAP